MGFSKACRAYGCRVSDSHSETAFFTSNWHGANPVAISSSAMACAALSRLMVVMPISRRFQIDPWIVEVNASFQVDAERLDHLAYSYANDPYRSINATLV